MEYRNEKLEKIKVSVEGTDPKQWRTLGNGDIIEAKSTVYARAYELAGLSIVKEVQVEKKVVSKDKIVAKTIESKSGEAKVETKVIKK